MGEKMAVKKRSDFKKYFQFFWRSWNIQASWNYERQMNMGFLYGIAPTEEQYALDRENFNPDTINAVKTSLMGPLSGVGDSFFQGTVRIIAFGLGISLAQQGSILGPILAIILSFIPAWFVTWYGGKLGYTATRGEGG